MEKCFRGYIQKYKSFTIMKEGNCDTFMIIEESKKWWQKIIYPDYIVLVRGIKYIKDAKQAIDEYCEEQKP